MIVNGLVNVNVSTLERRFQLSSTQMGLVCGGYDFFSIVIGIPLAFVGGRGGFDGRNLVVAKVVLIGNLVVVGAKVVRVGNLVVAKVV